jgi:O-antigen/teichoic acid export membrane protein
MNAIIRGSLFTVAMRWTDRLIGLLSTLVLARLLLPQDFGIIAMASLVIALADLLFDLGLHATLIQNPAPTQAHFDTAWTLALLQASAVALALQLCAPYAAQYFHEPRVQSVVQVLALSLLLNGMENIGVVNFQKEMHFGKDYVYMFCRRFSAFVATILAAWLLRSYWAFVIGTLSGRLVGVLCSYLMHPMRPRLSLARWRDILGVSQWLLVRTSGSFFEGQLHRAVVGRHDSAAVMGAYTMAGDISSMPSSELLMPINRVLFPAFVQARQRPDELKRMFLLAQGVQCLIAIPASAGLALVAPQLVLLMLGAQWAMAIPFVQILAVAYLASAMLSSTTCLLIALERVKVLALFTWAQVGFFAALAFGAFSAAQALQVAWLRLAVSVLSDLAFAALLLHVFEPLRLHELLRGVLRPVLAALCMAAGLLLLEGHWATTDAITLLVAKILTGAALYSASLALLWHAAGQPEGAEAYLLGHLKAVLKTAPR